MMNDIEARERQVIESQNASDAVACEALIMRQVKKHV